LEQGFSALIPCHSRMSARDRSQPERWHQILPMRALLDAAFSKRLQFGLQLGTDAIISVRAGSLSCWSCGADTRILTGIDVAFGPNELGFTIPEIGDHTELLDSVLSRLPGGLEIGSIKPRFSKTQRRSYVSNGCLHCNALIGEYHEYKAWDEQETVFAFSLQVSKQWKSAIESHCGYEKTWSVYRLAGQSSRQEKFAPGVKLSTSGG
jgi:hypothetical protein